MGLTLSYPASFGWRRPVGIFFAEDDVKLIDSPAIQKVLDEETIDGYWWIDVIWETLNELDKILSAEDRWLETIIPLPEWVKETNREHILWMLEMLDIFFPNIWRFCDMKKVILAVLVHDIWEYRIHDVAQSNPNAERLKKIRKRFERKIASILISKIQNEQLREDAQRALDSYFDFSVDASEIDTEILIVKLLDKLQGFIFWLEMVFYWNLKREKEYVLDNIKKNFKKIADLTRLLEQTMNRLMHERWIYSTWPYYDTVYLLKQSIKREYWIDVE